ncbi:MAG TPA: TetR/AcrR family transcriptional regulator [Ktedonobacterales bacterium]|jgi:AcrR family transcriptional regulator|nr:TetR/AcrR family transcriptional regulator [Ktedonobacterales bacterium]
MARRATTVSRARIQDVALTLFAKQGYALTSLHEIATALDVTKAALYFYFPAKALLLTSLADPLLDGVQTFLDDYTDGPLTAPAQREVVDALTTLLLAHRPVVAWLARDLTALAQPEVGNRITAHVTHLQRLLAGGDASLDGQVRVAAAVGALLGPLVALDTQDLSGLRDTLVAAALAPLSAA